MSNSELYGKEYSVPSGVLNALRQSNSQRSKNIVDNGKVSYSLLKRLKNGFDHLKPGTEEYKSYGGNIVKNWVNEILRNSRSDVYDIKKNQMDTGMFNRFKKTHNKDKNKNPTKPSGIDTKNKEFMRENKRIVIRITESELKQIIENTIIKENLKEENILLNEIIFKSDKKDPYYVYFWEIAYEDPENKELIAWKDVTTSDLNKLFREKPKKIYLVRKVDNYNNAKYYYVKPGYDHIMMGDEEKWDKKTLPFEVRDEKLETLKFNPDNIISGKEFTDKYVEFEDKEISKIIYDFGAAGANLGEGSYWNVTPESHEHYEYTEEYEGHIIDIIYAKIKPNAKIYVQGGIGGSTAYKMEKGLLNKIQKNADAAYDVEEDFLGLAVYNRKILEIIK